MSTTPPPDAISSSPPSKKNRWSRVGTVMRRSSTAFSIPGIRASSPSPSEPERDSDSTSIKGTSKPSSLKTSTLAPPLGNNGTTPSPIAESPAREAAALAPEPVGPSPLADTDVITSSPEPNLLEPIINEIPPTPATPAAPKQPALASEDEVVPAAEEAQVPSGPPAEVEEQGPTPSIHVEDAPAQEGPVEAVASAFEDAPARESAPSIASGASGVVQPVSAVPDVEHPTTYFDIPAPQPIAASSSRDYSTQIWAGQGRGSVSAKQSNASLASSVGWSNPQGNGNAGYNQGKPSVE
jgi:hypothetical protein